MSQHIGIISCNAEGAALCHKVICREAAEVMKQRNHPVISIHTHPPGEYMKFIYQNNWEGDAELR